MWSSGKMSLYVWLRNGVYYSWYNYLEDGSVRHKAFTSTSIHYLKGIRTHSLCVQEICFLISAVRCTWPDNFIIP